MNPGHRLKWSRQALWMGSLWDIRETQEPGLTSEYWKD